MRMTIGKQLAFGFGTVIALVSISAIVAYYAVASMKRSATQTSEETFPALTACYALETGLSRSLASLRGYIILGTDPDEAERFKSQRQLAWEDINAAAQELSQLSKLWTDEQDMNSLRVIDTEIQRLSAAQQDVEDIAYADNNIAADNLLRTEAAPKAEDMDLALAAIIEEEGTLEATLRRKEFLKIMSDIRGTLAVSLTTMRAYIVSGDSELRQRFDQQWQKYRRAYELALPTLTRMTDTQLAQWDRFAELHAEFDPLPTKMLQLREADDWNQANHLLREQAVPLAEKVSQAVGNLRQSANARMASDRANAVAAGTALTTTLIIILLLAVAIGGSLAVALSRKLVATIGHAVNTVAATAAEMSAATDKQQVMAQQQAAAVHEVTTTIEQLNRSAESSARQMKQALDRSTRALSLAGDGTGIVAQTMEGMSNLKDRVNDVANQIVQLSDQNSQISDVTTLVRDLAKRTNVLALNASVEAAQAGEQGAGFAVVAGEIRKLAEESALSADRIQQLVEQVQASTNSTVMATEEGTKTLKTGIELADKTTCAFHEVADSVGEVVDGIQQTSFNVKEQADAIGHIGSAMDDINRGAQQNEDRASSAKQGIAQLTEAVSRLQRIV